MVRALVATVLIVVAAPALAAAAPPAWLRDAAARPGITGAAATVLLDEAEVTISANSRTRTLRRYAVRIQDRSGRNAAALRELYVTSSGRIRTIRGWILRSDGSSMDLDGAHVADVAIVNNDVYNEVRVRAIGAGDHMEAGDIFGAEIESEEVLLYAQIDWALQERWPVALARRTLRLPSGWRASSVTFNAPTIEPQQQGTTWIWQVQDLAELPDEPAMPPPGVLVPRLAISVFGTAESEPAGQFESWQAVAAWLHRLSAARPVSDAVVRKARELWSGATELDRLASIARFAQRLQYVSIQTGPSER